MTSLVFLFEAFATMQIRIRTTDGKTTQLQHPQRVRRHYSKYCPRAKLISYNECNESLTVYTVTDEVKLTAMMAPFHQQLKAYRNLLHILPEPLHLSTFLCRVRITVLLDQSALRQRPQSCEYRHRIQATCMMPSVSRCEMINIHDRVLNRQYLEQT